MPYNNFARSNSTHEEWKIVDRFDSTYWSGLDAQVYFNNILINEAIQVSYMVSEQVRPYYGYASYLPTRIHHGARIIQGELTLNYKKDGYLFSLLQKIREQDTTDIAFGFESNRNLNTSPEIRQPIKYGDTYGGEIWQQLATGEFTGDVVKTIVDSASKERILNEGDVTSEPFGVPIRKGIFETRLEGFDLNIVFGTSLTDAKKLRWIGADEYELDPLDGSYADSVVTQDNQMANYHVGGGMKIVGVSIAGMSKTINDDGRALLETYSFTARDLVPLTRVGIQNVASSTGVVNTKKFDYVDTNTQGQIGNLRDMPSDQKDA